MHQSTDRTIYLTAPMYYLPSNTLWKILKSQYLSYNTQILCLTYLFIYEDIVQVVFFHISYAICITKPLHLSVIITQFPK